METIIQPVFNWVSSSGADSVTVGFALAMSLWFAGFAVSSMVEAFTITCDLGDD